MKTRHRLLAILGVAIASAFSQANAVVPNPVAFYDFNNTLNSSVSGAPALTAVDPQSTSGFGTATVFGSTQTVYNFNGIASPASDQAGLSLSTAGLLTHNDVYSVEMVFEFTQRDNNWRRILDVDNRQTDNGFYVSPSNTLFVYPVGAGSTFTNNTYHDVFLVDNAGAVTFYLDGSAQATVTTPVMDISSANLMNFFLDNTMGPAQNEYSDGSVARIRLWNAALTAPPPPPTGAPEPATLSLLVLGLAGVGLMRRRKAS